jgi:hypothetical protein
MDEGYIADQGHGGTVVVAEWIEGAPEESRWLGMKVGLNTKHRARLPVVVLRCARCGLLRSYAPGPVT